MAVNEATNMVYVTSESTNKVYSTYSGNPTLSIVNEVIREQGTLDYSSTIIGVFGAGAVAVIAFFVLRKKKIKLES